MSTSEYLDRTKAMYVTKIKCGQPSKKPNATETHLNQSLAGTLLYLGKTILSQACVIAFKIKQRLASLFVSELLNVNSIISGLLRLERKLLFTKVKASNHHDN